MITLVRVLFWVPAVALVASIVYLMNWNKERFYLAILTLPAIYFRIIRTGFVFIDRHSLFDTFK